jgi:excisionase family DNA binding protein
MSVQTSKFVEAKMLALLDQTKEPFVASEVEAEIAKAAAEKLQAVAAANQDVNVVVREMSDIIVPLPARAVQLILQLLLAMKDRTPVSIIPYNAELTTQQAADYLNVSRPYLISVIDSGDLPHRMVGRHRRIKFADLLAYEEKTRARRREAIADMVAEAKRLNLDADDDDAK